VDKQQTIFQNLLDCCGMIKVCCLKEQEMDGEDLIYFNEDFDLEFS